MLKKFGMVSAGVTAAMLAASPMAFAGDAAVQGDHDGGDWGHHKSHDGHDGWGKGHGKDGHGDNAKCAIGGTKAGHGGDADGRSQIANDGILGSIANVTAGGIGGPAVGNVTTLSCNNFLNHSLNDNFSGNHISALSVAE